MIKMPGWLLRWRRKLYWASGLLGVYCLLGFLALPWLAERQLTSLLLQRLGVQTQMADLRFNPFTFVLTADQVQLRTADSNSLFELEHLRVNLDPLHLLRLQVRLAEISLDAPQLYFTRYTQTDNTISRLAQQWAATAAPQTDPTATGVEASGGELFPLELSSFQYRNGSIHYRDEVPQTDFSTTIGPINLGISHFFTRDLEEQGSKNLVIQLEQDATLTWNSSFTVAPLQLSGQLQLERFSLTTPYRYLQDTLPILLQSGNVSAALDYRFSLQDGAPSLELSNVGVQVNELNATAKATGEPLLAGGTLALTGGSFNWPQMQAELAAVSMDAFTLTLQRNQEGVLNWLALLAELPASDAETAQPTAPATPLQLNIGAVSVGNTVVAFTDHSTATPATVTLQTEAQLQNFTLEQEAQLPFEVMVQAQTGGNLALQGTVQLFPRLNLSMSLAVSALALQPLQAYFDEFAQININSGELALEAQLQSDSAEPFSFKGDVQLGNLLLNDRQREEPLFSLASLQIDTLDFSLANRRLDISEVAVDELYARVLLDENGRNNIAAAFTSAQAAAAEAADPESLQGNAEAAAEVASTESGSAATAANPFSLSVGRLQLNNASSAYTDRNLPIVFETQMQGLNGAVSGFSTQSTAPMTVNLEGQVGAFGLVEINGELNPLALTRSTNIRLAFTNLELPTMTPYVIKFAGREIAEGRVDVGLEYVINNSELQASNTVVIRELRLGEEVDYPGALSLPLDLAVALLKNSEGVIDLEVPVSGNVNDPQFSFGPVIRQVIVNILTNIVTAPFRLLGALIGSDSEEIDNIRFRPGRSDLAPPEQEKLQKLLEALLQRPQLLLEIPAPFATAEDTLALQQSAVDARIEAQLAATENSAEQLSQRRQAALELLYTTAALTPTLQELQLQFTTSAVAATATDAAATDTATEAVAAPVFDVLAYSNHLRERLIAAETITALQLQTLATERQAAIAAFLSSNGELTAARLQLQEPATAELDDDWLSAKFDVGVAD